MLLSLYLDLPAQTCLACSLFPFASDFKACYVRGLNSVHLNAAQCKDWLIKWVQLSKKLKGKLKGYLFGAFILLLVIK